MALRNVQCWLWENQQPLLSAVNSKIIAGQTHKISSCKTKDHNSTLSICFYTAHTFQTWPAHTASRSSNATPRHLKPPKTYLCTLSFSCVLLKTPWLRPQLSARGGCLPLEWTASSFIAACEVAHGCSTDFRWIILKPVFHVLCLPQQQTLHEKWDEYRLLMVQEQRLVHGRFVDSVMFFFLTHMRKRMKLAKHFPCVMISRKWF